MTPEEQKKLEEQAILNFLGSTYGELKKLDGNIVGSSSTLGRRSDDVKQEVERFINSNKTQAQQPTVNDTPIIKQPEIQQPQVQAQQPVVPIIPPVIEDNQLAFNFDVNEKDELFSLIEKILTRLDKLHRKVDELTLVHSDFIQTYQQAQEIVSKKKSPTKKTISKKEEN